jgi:hypothetical protein
MKTRMNDSSLEANQIVDKTTQKEIIEQCVKRIGAITQKGISFATGIDRHVVSGRVNDLMHLQKLKVVGKVADIAGSTLEVNKYAIRKETDPLNVFDESWEDKYKQLEKFVINENLWIKFELLVKHEL